MNRLDLDLWKRFYALAKPYWRSEKKGQAWGLLALLVVLLVGYTVSNVFFNQQTGEFASALAAHNTRRFWRAVILFSGLLVVAVPVYSFYYYVRDRLAVQWRLWFTDRILARYFGNHAYYRVASEHEIDNPDQRISEDVRSFTAESLNFLLIFTSALFELIGFSGVLWSISRLLVVILVIYAVAGTFVTVGIFSNRMISLYFEKLKREADFRFGMVRIRENAESIAFYRGEGQEKSQVQRRFMRVFDNFLQLIRWSLGLNSFTYFYSFITLVLPSLIVAPRVLSGEMEVGRVIQAQGAFASVLAALTVFVNNLEYLSGFAASVKRLDTFSATLAPEQVALQAAGNHIMNREGDDLRFDGFTLQTPDHARTLIKALNVRVAPGEGLLISGESGSGKSSLLRAVAGLWQSGSGIIERPKPEDMLFLPQRAYMILGNLRQQLIYPNLARDVSEQELREVLDRVNLRDLVTRCNGFEAEMDFDKVLSEGERQRLAFARILLNRPKYALLDEATSALDRENEAALYSLLASLPITLVSVSHHQSLLKYHAQVLELTGGGAWRVCPAEEFSFSETTA